MLSIGWILFIGFTVVLVFFLYTEHDKFEEYGLPCIKEEDTISEAKSVLRKALGVDETLKKREAAEQRESLRGEVGQWYDLSEPEDTDE